MAKRVAIPYQDVKLRIVGPQDYFDAHRIQRLDMPVNIPNTTINELGNAGHAGMTADIPEVTATFQAFDVSHVIYSILTGTDPTAYPPAGVDVSNFDYCDLIAYVKEKSANEHLKCMHLKYAKITDFTFSYSADGDSTEEYSVGGSEKRYLANDCIVESGHLDGSREFTVSQDTPKQLRNGEYFLSVIVDGTWLDEGTTGEVALEDKDYSVAGSVITVGSHAGTAADVCIAVYHSTTNDTMAWTGISDGTVPAAIRGKNIPVYIYASDDTQERQYRVQSVSIRGTFPNTAIKEMGNTSLVGYVVEPADVTGDLDVLDVDNELIALLTTGARLGDSYGEYGVDQYENYQLKLQIEIKDPTDDTTVLKTVEIPKMRITSDGTTANVGAQLMQTFSFSSDDGQCIVYSGSAP